MLVVRVPSAGASTQPCRCVRYVIGTGDGQADGRLIRAPRAPFPSNSYFYKDRPPLFIISEDATPGIPVACHEQTDVSAEIPPATAPQIKMVGGRLIQTVKSGLATAHSPQSHRFQLTPGERCLICWLEVPDFN